MKKVLELLVCFLHPIAVVLIWIDLATRRDTGGGEAGMGSVQPYPARAVPLRANGWRPMVRPSAELGRDPALIERDLTVNHYEAAGTE